MTDTARTHKASEASKKDFIAPKLLGKPYFQRKKNCPFSGKNALPIDYKDVRMLTKFVSDYGKITPAHITGVSPTKQRELAAAIKRARHLALLPYAKR